MESSEFPWTISFSLISRLFEMFPKCKREHRDLGVVNL